MKLLLYPGVDDERLHKIREAADNMTVVNARSLDEAQEHIAAADGFFGKMTPELLSLAQRLRWIQTPTASLEHYLFPELIAHPCVLTNMRGLFSDVIADHVMGYVLAFARNLHLYVRQQIGRHWHPIGGENDRSDFITGPAAVSAIDRAHLHLSDCSMGVIGLGAIGRETVARAAAFNMKTFGYDPYVGEKPPHLDRLFPEQELESLLGQSDFVVVCAPHTPKTEGLFQRRQFECMKRSAYFINIGRGAIAGLDALVEALRNKEIAGAALDVFETEPLPIAHPLWEFPNVLLTPHVAAASPHIARRHLETLLENIRRFASGQPLSNVVDKTNWF